MVWGSVIVAGGAIISAVTVFYFERRRKAKRLRTALKSELMAMEPITEILRDEEIDLDEEDFTKMIGYNSTTIYDAAGTELGLLTDAETYSVVQYYSNMENILETLKFDVQRETSRLNVKNHGDWLEFNRRQAIHILENPPGIWRRLTMDNPPRDLDWEDTISVLSDEDLDFLVEQTGEFEWLSRKKKRAVQEDLKENQG